MTRIKIMNVRDKDIPYINKWAKQNDVDVDLTKEMLTETMIDTIKGFDGLSLSQQHLISEEVFAKLKQYGIKQVTRRSAGLDTYDLDLVTKYNVIISNVPPYSPSSIAEFAVTQAINIVRYQKCIQHKVRSYDFHWEPSILSQSVQNLAVTVIGTGRIGSIVAEISGRGYNSEVVAYDPFPNTALAEFVDYKGTLEAATKETDIVTVHIPATKYNHHLFSNVVFSNFKKGAIFVNAARGSIADTQALLSVIDSGRIRETTLDTYEYKRGLFPGGYRGKEIDDVLLKQLIEREDIILTPHIVFYTKAAVEDLIVGALDAAIDALTSGTTKLRVN